MNDPIRFTALLALCFSMLAGTSPANELQDRLNQSVAGDVVEVSPGVFEGALTIPDGVILWGAGAGQTILDGAGADVVVSMGKDSVLGGVTIQNGKTGVNNQGNYIGVFESELTGLTRAGIWLQNGSAVIANNRFMGRDKVGTGIFCLSANPMIANNWFEDLAFGVRVYHEFIPSLIGNVFLNNRIGIDVGGNAKLVLQDNLWSGNEVAVRGWDLDPSTELNADVSDWVLVRGVSPDRYIGMMDASYETIASQHPAVIYDLPAALGEFDVILLFPWATFSIGASAVDTVVADHFAYDWVEPRELNSELSQPEHDRPWVRVNNPDITEKGLDRYVLENRFVHPGSYYRDEQGLLVFERMTTLSRIDVLPPPGYRVLDCNLPYAPIEEGGRTGLRIRDIGATTVKAVFEPSR